MQIQINTGKDVDGDAGLSAHAEEVIGKTLHHLKNQLTRVEVHLDDENGEKGGSDDKSCTMEARPRGLQPVAVSHRAGSTHQAIDGAARKLKSALERQFGKLEGKQRRPVIIEDEGPQDEGSTADSPL